MKKLTGLLILGLVIGVAAGFIAALSRNSPEKDIVDINESPGIGKKIPSIIMQELDGDEIDIASLIGKPLVINYWATWCPPCKLEMPLLQEFSMAHMGEVIVVGINAKESNATVSDFMRKNGIGLDMILDLNGNMQDAFRITGLPTTFFVDETGVLRAQHIGILDQKLLSQYGNMIGLAK
ncbi:MAG: TlpA family protein disulfide reductase [Anaerolineaceae bacterium]|nr:TlpA family protein disulfide reductase [Anaerolineaceae bacterium]